MRPYFSVISFLMVNFMFMMGGCTHSTPGAAGPGAVSVAVIASGPAAGVADTKPGGEWIADQEQLDALVLRMSKGARMPDPGKALPHIDFAAEGVLFIWMGQRPTGGYALELAARRAEIEKTTVMVPIRRITPGQDAAVTQMITQPYLMLRIGKGAYDTVTILDPDGPQKMVVPVRMK